MSTAVATPPVPAQHAAPLSADGVGSSRTYAPIAPSTHSPHAVTPNSRASKLPFDNASPTSSSDGTQFRAEAKRSPLPSRGPKIIVKKEPASPDMPTTTRHRPQRLNLSNHNIVHSSGALTARPSGPGSGHVQDMGLACLSPGFHTQDPTMREQLQRSLDVRERQRQIIEARQKHGKGGPSDVEETRNSEIGAFGRTIKTPQTSRRKGPPPGLSIAPPAHQQFASDRVIQSAPINQTFTGLRNNPTSSRQVANAPSNLGQSSHIHHVHAQQTNNRLPPISDVFPEPLGTARNHYHTSSPGHSSHSNVQPPMPSPGFPPPQFQQPLPTSRPREYKSAEEAVQSLSGGREDLLPRLVHYGGHQPPTPPSPMPKQGQSSTYSHPESHRSSSTRRRGRDEYEMDNGTPPGCIVLGYRKCVVWWFGMLYLEYCRWVLLIAAVFCFPMHFLTFGALLLQHIFTMHTAPHPIPSPQWIPTKSQSPLRSKIPSPRNSAKNQSQSQGKWAGLLPRFFLPFRCRGFGWGFFVLRGGEGT